MQTMKKVFVAILAFVYITTSTGATINMHYCMGKMINWGFGHNDSKKCGKCGMEEKDSKCCKDIHKFVKNDSDQKTSKPGFQILQLMAAALPGSFIEIPSHPFLSVTEEHSISRSHPRNSSVALYIRNCVFLI